MWYTHLTQARWMTRETYMSALPLKEPRRAFGQAQVIALKHSGFVPSNRVLGLVGWQDYVVFHGDGKGEMISMNKVPASWDPKHTLTLSVTGLTGFFGMTAIGKVKPGNVVLVGGSAGATGSVAGQVAKQVVGIGLVALSILSS